MHDKRYVGDRDTMKRCLAIKVLTVDYSTDSIALECVKYLLGRKYSKNIE